MDDEHLQRALPVRDPNPAREQMRDCIIATLEGKPALEVVTITSDLISYLRDQLLNGLGAVRRNAAAQLKESGMTTAEISTATGMTEVTIRRLITESKY